MRIKPKESVRKLKKYSPGLFRGKIKLDANENSFDVPENVRQKILARAANLSLNRYPDPAAGKLRKKIAGKIMVPAGKIFTGNGSDEIIFYLMAAYLNRGDYVVVPDPTFEMYSIIAGVFGAEVKNVPLDKNFDIDEKEIIRQAKNKKAKFIFISYPNNPTGNCFTAEKTEKIIKKSGCFVVIDEAYYEFSGKTFINKLNKYPNLIVLRTFSKAYSMAGLRVGYMAAAGSVAGTLDKIRLPYNINSFSQAAAECGLDFSGALKKNVKTIRRERDKMYSELSGFYDITRSDANFLFFRAKNAEKIKKYFKKEGISIRMYSSGRLKNHIRVTVGRPEENKRVLRILKAVSKGE